MTTRIAALALLLSLAAPRAGAQKDQTAAPPAPAGAATQNTTFHSDVLHLSYVYPSSYANANGLADESLKQEKDKAEGVTKEAIGCVSVPITAMDFSKGFRMIFMMRLDGVCLGEQATAAELGLLTSQVLTGSLSKFGPPKLGTTTDYDISGHSASTVAGTVHADTMGKTLQSAASCSISGKDILCWEFLSDDCSALSTMSGYMVQFEGHDPAPVIPAKYAPACK